MTITQGCPVCDEENPSVTTGKIEWEVVEGPKRTERGVGNVDFCDECGNVIHLSREIPVYQE